MPAVARAEGQLDKETRGGGQLPGRSIFTDSDPLDVSKVAGVDENHIDSGRPVDLSQSHREFGRRQRVSFTGGIDEHTDSKGHYATDDKDQICGSVIGPKNPATQPIDRSRAKSGEPSEEDVTEDRGSRQPALNVDFEGIISWGFDPNNLTLLLPGQIYIERSHTLFLAVDSDRGANGRRRHRDSLHAPLNDRRAIRSQHDAHENQGDKKETCTCIFHSKPPLKLDNIIMDANEPSCQHQRRGDEVPMGEVAVKEWHAREDSNLRILDPESNAPPSWPYGENPISRGNCFVFLYAPLVRIKRV